MCPDKLPKPGPNPPFNKYALHGISEIILIELSIKRLNQHPQYLRQYIPKCQRINHKGKDNIKRLNGVQGRYVAIRDGCRHPDTEVHCIQVLPFPVEKQDDLGVCFCVVQPAYVGRVRAVVVCFVYPVSDHVETYADVVRN